MKNSWLIPCVVILASAASAGERSDRERMGHSVSQLRSSIGKWSTVTEFLNPDGSVAGAVKGTYEFSWVVSDRVVAGKSDIPDLKRTAGILFYVNEKDRTIEMVSVGADGKLWIMTGPLGEETRHSQEYELPGGGKGQLRFTRYNVTEDSFESKMELTEDGGKTWKAGNHQVFRRLG
jgi:hypothetical protein